MEKLLKGCSLLFATVLLLAGVFLFNVPVAHASSTLYIDDGPIMISDSTEYKIHQRDPSQPTSNYIYIYSNVTANITLFNVYMTPEDYPPIYMFEGSTLNLTLAYGNSSTLIGPDSQPAIYVPKKATLNITSESDNGFLYASGGDSAPGIEMFSDNASEPSTINIAGGNVIATGSYQGAGIGTRRGIDTGSYTINISGGNVTATGGNFAAGIGGGDYGVFPGRITISGGTVRAQPGNGHNISIGGGHQPSNSSGTIEVTGGNVLCANSSASTFYSIGQNRTVYISGGYVRASGVSNAPTVGASDSRAVYENTITLPQDDRHSVESLSLALDGAGYAYGINDFVTSAHGVMYFYLPDSSAATAALSTNIGSYSGYYRKPGTRVFKMDQSALSITGMDPVYPSGASINPDTSGGDGTGAVTFSYSGRGSTLYGPNATAPSADGDYTVTATRDGDATYYAATATYDFKIKSLTVDAIADQTYTGSALTPLPVVKDGSTVLVKDTDYSLSYSDNINAGTATASITGINGYAGFTGSRTFTINPKSITFTVDAIADKAYTGSALTPLPVVKDGSTVLLKDTDYTLSYSNNTNAGIATLSITGTGNYLGSTGSRTFTIAPKAITFTVDAIADKVYTGSAFTPLPVVKDGSTVLLKDTGYTLSYSNNTNAGTATLSITGKGNYLGSTGSRTFLIQPASGLVIQPVPDQIYSGAVLTPSPVVKDGLGHTLQAGVDFDAAYANNIHPGTATLSVTGKGNYTGNVSASFTIARREVSVSLGATGSGRALDNATLTIAIENAVDLPKGTITFKKDGTLISAGVPIVLNSGVYTAQTVWTNIPAGKYTLTATYVPATNDDYIALTDGELADYSITKRSQTGFEGDVLNKAYNDGAFTISATGGQSSGGITYKLTSGNEVISLSGDLVSILKTGTAVITATKAGDSRYHSAAATITIIVEKSLTSILTPPTASDVTIFSPLSSSKLTGGKGSVTGSFAWSSPDSIVKKAGTYEAVFTPDDTQNYLPCRGTVNVNVKSLVSDAGTGAQVDLSQINLPDTASLSVSLSDQSGTGPAKDAADSLAGSGNVITGMSVYQVNMKDQTGNPIESVGGVMELKLPVPAGAAGEVKLYRYDMLTHSMTPLQATVENGFIVFKTNRGGYYVIISGSKNPAVPAGTAQGTGTWPLWLWLGLGLLAAVAAASAIILIIISSRRKKASKKGTDI